MVREEEVVEIKEQIVFMKCALIELAIIMEGDLCASADNLRVWGLNPSSSFFFHSYSFCCGCSPPSLTSRSIHFVHSSRSFSFGFLVLDLLSLSFPIPFCSPLLSSSRRHFQVSS